MERVAAAAVSARKPAASWSSSPLICGRPAARRLTCDGTPALSAPRELGRAWSWSAGNEQITVDQAEELPQPLAARLRALVGEYEGRASREAECARDADKLDMLLQALEYREAGWRNLDPFIQTAVAALRTGSGRRL